MFVFTVPGESSYSQFARKSESTLQISAKGKVKSCYIPLRLGRKIVLVSSGIDFVNTPR